MKEKRSFVIMATLLVTFVFIIFTTVSSFAAVYLFGDGSGSSPSGEGEIAEINLSSTCVINFIPGTYGTVSLGSLIYKHCIAPSAQSPDLPSSTAKFYFTRDVKVILEIAGAKGGDYPHRRSGGKGGYTKIEFVIKKDILWDYNVHYVIGTKGQNANEWQAHSSSGGGGGSMIVIGPSIYVTEGTYRFPKDKVIAVIAGGGGGSTFSRNGENGGGGNSCGGGGWKGGCSGKGGGGSSADPNIVALCGGGGDAPGKGFFSGNGLNGGGTGDGGTPGLYEGGVNLSCSGECGAGGFGGGGSGSKRCDSLSCWGLSGGGGGYGGGRGGNSSTDGGGGGGGAYCGFFGQSVGCSGITGYNNGDGWGKITLIPQ